METLNFMGNINRMLYIFMGLDKITIHFELYENNDERVYILIRNFLFKFLILKNYGAFNYISKDINIFIEVSSDYTKFNEDYKILKLFRRYDIKLKGQNDFYEKKRISFLS